MPPRSLPRSVKLGLVLTVAAFAAMTALAAGQTSYPPPVDESANVAPPLGREDPGTPRVVLSAAADELGRIVEPSADDGARRALDSVRQAQDALKAELSGLRPTNLAATIAHVRSAQEGLESTRTRGRLRPELEAVARRLDAASRRIAQDIVDVAARAGADQRTLATARARIARGDGLTRAGQHSAGAGAYAVALEIASDGLVFDIRRFEQNIRDTFDGETVGYSYAIVRNGDLFSADGEGVARTTTDQGGAPPIPHGPNVQMNIASVTKTVTAAAVMKLMQQYQLDLDESVAPFLPAEWSPLPVSIFDLTFRDLMTQRSGLGGNAVGGDTDLATLRGAIAQGVDPADKIWVYQNANFGLFRVIIPALLGVDIYGDEELEQQFGKEAAAALVAADTYADYMQDEVFKTFGVDCKPLEEPQFGPRPVAYRFPDDATPGEDLGDWTLGCGGGGLNISTLELARFFARLRYTEEILSPTRRKQMTDGFIGYMDPEDGWDWNDGAFGTYHSHGGDLNYVPANDGIGTCAISFPITIQAVIAISSIGGTYGYQCAELANAFEDAWVSQ